MDLIEVKISDITLTNVGFAVFLKPKEETADSKVTIDEIIDNTFYAKISIRKDEEIFLIDARPSDSIAIALRAEAPIFITQSVLDEAGVVMKGGEIPSESGLDELTPVEPVPRTQLQILEDYRKFLIQIPYLLFCLTCLYRSKSFQSSGENSVLVRMSSLLLFS